MKDNTKLGLEILQAALVIGISGDYLLRVTPWGLNAFIWVLLISVAVFGLSYFHKREILTTEAILLHAASIFFASTFLYRESIPLLMLNVLAIFTTWAVLSLRSLKLTPQLAGVSHYILGFVWSGVNLLLSPFLLVFNDVKWKSSNNSAWSKTIFPILRGLVIVAPLLIIFGGLFMAADAAFEGVVNRTLNIETDQILSHIFLIGFFSWIVAGYLRANFYGSLMPESFLAKTSTEVVNNPKVEEFPKRDWRNFNSSWLPNALTLGKIEISIIWTLLNLLFLAFVIVQVPYLFGGFEYVQATANVTLAEYARRGVAELGLVTVLVLPLLLLGHWFIRGEDKSTEKLFKVMAGIQIGLLFVIMISSAQRMILYTGKLGYGMTLERLYAMVLLAMLGAVFIWFATTILSGNRRSFAWGFLWIALFTLGTLNIVNPSDFVLRTNYRLMQDGRKFDAYYNFRDLGADGVPKMIEIMPLLSEHQRCEAENGLYSIYKDVQQLEKINDEVKENRRIINWNYSRWRAKNAIDNYKKQNELQTWKNCKQLYPDQNISR